mgnify:CR=1 FL=1
MSAVDEVVEAKVVVEEEDAKVEEISEPAPAPEAAPACAPLEVVEEPKKETGTGDVTEELCKKEQQLKTLQDDLNNLEERKQQGKKGEIHITLGAFTGPNSEGITINSASSIEQDSCSRSDEEKFDKDGESNTFFGKAAYCEEKGVVVVEVSASATVTKAVEAKKEGGEGAGDAMGDTESAVVSKDEGEAANGKDAAAASGEAEASGKVNCDSGQATDAVAVETTPSSGETTTVTEMTFSFPTNIEDVPADGPAVDRTIESEAKGKGKADMCVSIAMTLKITTFEGMMQTKKQELEKVQKEIEELTRKVRASSSSSGGSSGGGSSNGSTNSTATAATKTGPKRSSVGAKKSKSSIEGGFLNKPKSPKAKAKAKATPAPSKSKATPAPSLYTKGMQALQISFAYAVEYRAPLMFTASVAYIFLRGDDLSV